jgi:hypothetical protein
MPLYMIERNFGEQLDLTDEDVEFIDEIGAEEGVHWVFSFLTADRRRTYCLYEAPSPDAIDRPAASIRQAFTSASIVAADPRGIAATAGDSDRITKAR